MGYFSNNHFKKRFTCLTVPWKCNWSQINGACILFQHLWVWVWFHKQWSRLWGKQTETAAFLPANSAFPVRLWWRVFLSSGTQLPQHLLSFSSTSSYTTPSHTHLWTCPQTPCPSSQHFMEEHDPFSLPFQFLASIWASQWHFRCDKASDETWVLIKWLVLVKFTKLSISWCCHFSLCVYVYIWHVVYLS